MKLKTTLLCLFFLFQIINAQTLLNNPLSTKDYNKTGAKVFSVPKTMFPLSSGNKYQCIYSSSSFEGFYSFKLLNRIMRDTLINGISYYAFDSYDELFYRYDTTLNHAIGWWNNNEGVYCDFNVPSGGTFSHFSGGTTYTTAQVSAGWAVILGKNRFRFKWEMPFGYYDHIKETFAEGIGKVLKEYSTGGTYSGSSALEVVNALIKDSLGNYVFYSDRFKPQIVFTPFYQLQKNTFKYLSLTVNHEFNARNYSLGQYHDAIVYIESVYASYFYQKDTSITQLKKATGYRTIDTYNYTIIIPIDTSLIVNGYKLKYKITASDKAYIPETSYLPDSAGYYEAVYNPPTSSEEPIDVFNYSLEQNYPNPFNSETKIKFSLSSWNMVQLKVYDILGREVRTLFNGYKEPGIHEFRFDGNGLQSGVYFYKIITDKYSSTKKMVILK